MYLSEAMKIIEDGSRERAKQKLYHMLREGLTNGAAIPDVETEAEQAAHHLLGCINYIALITVYATADDTRVDNPAAAAVVSELADERLLLLVEAVLVARGPIGEHTCASW